MKMKISTSTNWKNLRKTFFCRRQLRASHSRLYFLRVLSSLTDMYLPVIPVNCSSWFLEVFLTKESLKYEANYKGLSGITKKTRLCWPFYQRIANYAK